ncbi:MAG: LuxR C-terminal-related transcriptional regulator [Dysgonamonadaceae bacterium]|jgi:DNA-binding CsgD family transcriptional regulator|nr:LuxR C-terminal-related transcriptional regulator [Dysgonamonadaceae bacterium]
MMNKNKKFLVCALIFASCFLDGIAQRGEIRYLDSLLNVVKNPNISGNELVRSLLNLSQEYDERGDSVVSQAYFDHASLLVAKLGERKNMIFVYNAELSKLCNEHPKNTRRILQLADSLLYLAQTVEDTESKAYAYYNYGYTLLVVLRENEGINYIFKAIEYAEQMSDNNPKKYSLLYRLYYSVLEDFRRKADVENLNKYIEMIVEAAEKTKDPNKIAFSNINRAYYNYRLLADLENPAKSSDVAKFISETMEYADENSDYIYADTYLYMVNVFCILNAKYPNVVHVGDIEAYLAKAEDAIKETNLNVVQQKLISVKYYMNLTLKHYDAAEKNIYEYLAVADSFDLEERASCYYELAKLCINTKRWQQATEALDTYITLYQNHISQDNSEERLKLETKYGLQKKEMELEFIRSRDRWYATMAAVAVLASVILFFYFRGKAKTADALHKLARSEANAFKLEIERTTREMLSTGLQVARKKEIISILCKKIHEHIEDEAVVEEIEQLIRNDSANDREFEDFRRLVSEINPEFYKRLAERVKPANLTPLDLKYCIYILTGVSNKEIAKSLRVVYGTVKTQKNSLKKKLRLQPEDELEQFLKSIYPSAPPQSSNCLINSDL